MESKEDDSSPDNDDIGQFEVEKKPKFNKKMSNDMPKWLEIKLEVIKLGDVRDEESEDKEFMISNELIQPMTQPKVLFTSKAVESNTEDGKIINQYKLLSNIGSGSYSKVKKAVRNVLNSESSHTSPFAIKIMHILTLKREIGARYTAEGQMEMYGSLELIFTEILILATISHSNIIKLFEVISGEQYLYMVLEFGKFGQLSTWDEDEEKYVRKQELIDKYFETDESLQTYDDQQAVEQIAKLIFKPIFEALKYLHDQNIVHRDIKLDNILITEDLVPKLSDFTVAQKLSSDSQKLYHEEGTTAYMAPEYFLDRDSGIDPFPADIYSLGITLYTFINEKLPFYAESQFEVQNCIKSDTVPLIENGSSEINDLIQNMGAKIPENRFIIQECLDHSWLE